MGSEPECIISRTAKTEKLSDVGNLKDR